MVEEWDEIRETSRNRPPRAAAGLRAGVPRDQPGNTFLLHEHVEVTRLGKDSWNLVGVIVDITARRDAELALAAEKERLAVTLGSMTEGVITIDPDGRVLFINRAAADLTQWELGSEAVGRPVSEVCVLREREDGCATTELPVGGPGGRHSRGAPAEHPDEGRSDRIRLVEGRLVPIANISSKRVGAVLVLRDVTERQRMEEKLQNAAKMESVGILAGGIAHDFNNILTAVLSNLSLLQLDMGEMPEQARLLDEAVRATKRAAELTLQLLTFAKGRRPGADRRPAAGGRQGGGHLRPPRLRREERVPAMPDDLWAANVDKAQISQVIQNLVINATQAMPDGGTLRIDGLERARARGLARRAGRGRLHLHHGDRHGRRDPPEHSEQDLRPLLHDEAAGARPRPRDRLLDHQAPPGAHRGELGGRQGDHVHVLAARRGVRGSLPQPVRSPSAPPAAGPGPLHGRRGAHPHDGREAHAQDGPRVRVGGRRRRRRSSVTSRRRNRAGPSTWSSWT
jgi:PAS domain S-box-containing protein